MNKMFILLLCLFCIISTHILYTHIHRAHWSCKAKTDLQFIHTCIKENHPGPVDPDVDPHFTQWLISGYTAALKRAESVHTWEEYIFTLLYYVNGYKDAHVRLNCPSFFKKCAIQWPGFIAEYRNGSFYVALVAQEWDHPIPPVGAEITQLNGKKPHELMTSNIFPYFGNEQFERDWLKNTPRLLLYFGNTWQEPITSCVYKTSNTEHRIIMRYKEISYDSLQPIMKKFSTQSMSRSNTFATEELKNGGVWISIPTFNGVNPKVHATLEKTITYAGQLSEKEYIVFDVRGNTGGASDYAERIVRNLFGNTLVNRKLGRILNAPRSYRVSADNIAHYKQLLHSVTQRYGANSEAYEWVHGMLTCVETAHTEKKSICTYQPIVAHSNNDNTQQEHSYTKPVFLLTDGCCFSACLMFADMLLAFDNVIHIGLPTGGDTPYAEVRNIKCSDDSLSLLIPTNIRHNLPRKHNECYIPRYRYTGDIHDTAALQGWVISLYQSISQPSIKQ